MSAGIILTELHSPRCGLDDQGNLVLNPSSLGGPPPVGRLVGKGILGAAVISYAKGAANVVNVSVQLADVYGTAIAAVRRLDFWLSDAATGLGLTATTASGGLAIVGVAGALLGTPTASKMLECTTDATGKLTIAITDTAKTAFYPVVNIPSAGGTGVTVGVQLAAANYG